MKIDPIIKYCVFPLFDSTVIMIIIPINREKIGKTDSIVFDLMFSFIKDPFPDFKISPFK